MRFLILCLIALVAIYGEKNRRYSKQRKRATEYRRHNQQNQFENEPTQRTEPEQTEEVDAINYKNAYQPRYLFTKNEWLNYKKLRDIAEIKGYIICPKVRLLDIIEPKKGEKKYKTLFYKIQAKHVDFVICDKDMHIKAIIELDDNSHDKQDRKERDEFVNLILRSVGYKVIHTKYITDDILDLV